MDRSSWRCLVRWLLDRERSIFHIWFLEWRLATRISVLEKRCCRILLQDAFDLWRSFAEILEGDRPTEVSYKSVATQPLKKAPRGSMADLYDSCNWETGEFQGNGINGIMQEAPNRKGSALVDFQEPPLRTESALVEFEEAPGRRGAAAAAAAAVAAAAASALADFQESPGRRGSALVDFQESPGRNVSALVDFYDRVVPETQDNSVLPPKVPKRQTLALPTEIFAKERSMSSWGSMPEPEDSEHNPDPQTRDEWQVHTHWDDRCVMLEHVTARVAARGSTLALCTALWARYTHGGTCAARWGALVARWATHAAREVWHQEAVREAEMRRREAAARLAQAQRISGGDSGSGVRVRETLTIGRFGQRESDRLRAAQEKREQEAEEKIQRKMELEEALQAAKTELAEYDAEVKREANLLRRDSKAASEAAAEEERLLAELRETELKAESEGESARFGLSRLEIREEEFLRRLEQSAAELAACRQQVNEIEALLNPTVPRYPSQDMLDSFIAMGTRREHGNTNTGLDSFMATGTRSDWDAAVQNIRMESPGRRLKSRSLSPSIPCSIPEEPPGAADAQESLPSGLRKEQSSASTLVPEVLEAPLPSKTTLTVKSWEPPQRGSFQPPVRQVSVASQRRVPSPECVILPVRTALESQPAGNGVATGTPQRQSQLRSSSQTSGRTPVRTASSPALTPPVPPGGGGPQSRTQILARPQLQRGGPRTRPPLRSATPPHAAVPQWAHRK